MASQYPPSKNAAFDLGFVLYKNDGTLIANPVTLVGYVSKDFGDYVQITSTVGTLSEEDATYGQNKCNLASATMNADILMLHITDTGTAGCVPFTTTIYTAAQTLDSIATNINAIQGTVNSIGSGTGAALNFAATGDNTAAAVKAIAFVGSQTGAYASTASEDGARHVITDSGGTPDIDIVYVFDIGSARNAAKVIWKGYVTNADTVTVQAYNGSTWDTRATILGTTSTTNVTKDISLLASHTGSGADAGKVYIRFTSTGQSAIVINTDELLVAGVAVGQSVGYADGAVWVKAAGASGQTPFINGTADNPCPWTDAIAIAANLGLQRFHIYNDETVTLSSATTDKSLIGDHWYLALGGQNVNDSYFYGASVSGTGTAVNHLTFEDCHLGSVALPPFYAFRCGFGKDGGTTTASANGEYVLVDCYSMAAGSAVPVFDFATNITATTGVNIRRWSGGTQTSFNSFVNATLEVVTGGGQTITTGGGNVELRGTFRSAAITTSGTGLTRVIGTYGPVAISGTGGTVRLYGTGGVLTDTSTGTTIERIVTTQPGDSVVASNMRGTDNAITSLAGIALTSDITGLNDFDPTNDIVAHVTLVDTTTTNTDMRGTDGAITSLTGVALTADITGLNDLSVSDIEASTVLAKEATVAALDFSTLTAAQVWQYVTRELTSAGAGGATAEEVWAYATREITNAADFAAPTAAENALAVRDELVLELARIDDVISSRAPASTALSTGVWTSTKAGYLNTAISTRSSLNTTSLTDALNAYDVTTHSEMDAYITNVLNAIPSEPDNAALALIRKILTNKTQDNGATYVVYDDDGETPLGTFTWNESSGTRGPLT